jgi:ribonuclease BN (tRNA processing enzyme)
MFSRFDLEGIQHKINWKVLEPGKSTRLAGFKLSTIRSPHTHPDVSLSVRLEGGGKRIVFSGDSGWNDELVKFSEGADLLLCECTYYESAHLRIHMNYPELSKNRGRFNVGRMILTHLGRETLQHMPDIDLEMGFDGMKFEL